MDVVKLLLTNSKFWAAMMILANAILLWAIPDFPPAIWSAVDALVAVVIAVLATNDSIQKAKTARMR